MQKTTQISNFLNLKNIFFIFIIGSFLQSCGVLYPNRILDADKDFVYDTFLNTTAQDFTLRQGDIIELYVFPKKGYILIESQISNTTNTPSPQFIQNSIPYTIDENGMANLPILGPVKISSMTEHAAELYLTELYREFYIDPFVNITISNKYITVFRGSAEARQINITRPDITILDAIGQAGGIPESGKAAKIKILRTVNGVTATQFLDLSDMNDLVMAQSYIQPNDIIYIEPGINTQFFKEISPIITTVSSIVVIYAFFANLNK